MCTLPALCCSFFTYSKISSRVGFLREKGLREKDSFSSPLELNSLTSTSCEVVPLCILDASILQSTLYRSFPQFYDWMLQRKTIEEQLSGQEYRELGGSVNQEGEVHCLQDHCNVATGGMYLCPHVLYGILAVLRNISGPFCIVGSGSLTLEAWVLAVSNLDVVSFDLFDEKYQQMVAETIKMSFGKSRWTQISGPFEDNEKIMPCGAIVFDTNIRGDLNLQHWRKIETTLSKDNPYMWVQSNNWREFSNFCHDKSCAFEHMGATRAINGCFPDKSVIPANMHPEVLKVGDSYDEVYQFGQWRHPTRRP